MNNITTIKKRKFTRLYNYSGSSIVIPLYVPDNRSTKDTLIDGKKYDSPGYIDVTWDDIECINDKTSAIKNGLVRFSKEDEKAIYEEFNIDWKNILFEEVIDDIIMNPTKEKLQRIIDIKDGFMMERVRGELVCLLNTGADISTKTIEVINARANELRRNQKITGISLLAKPADDKDISKLKDEVATLKAMVEKLSKAKV